MGRNKSSERLKLEAILEGDDRWWDRDELFNKWMLSVPPSVAKRAAEKSYQKRQGSRGERTTDLSQQQLQRIGAKHIFNTMLGAMRQYNKIEERRRGGVVEIRLVPEFVSTMFEKYFSVLVVSDEAEFSLHDPHSKVLVLSVQRCRDMTDEELEALFRWAQLHEDDHVAFSTAGLMAKKVMNERNVTKALRRAEA